MIDIGLIERTISRLTAFRTTTAYKVFKSGEKYELRDGTTRFLVLCDSNEEAEALRIKMISTLAPIIEHEEARARALILQAIDGGTSP